ncbi:MAG: 3-deoxy-manno-octulosonate cytidylyltransferase [Chlamydiales bacterium]|jgi:3-deoxy-manno-octulosonate cytidylyltransferase (CMP-KDO synthetase)|nr:3-deoxy-manno-octulosonate cytidylyltransferase [Chlamydiales bacterium]
MLKIICVIPARLYSTRFPKKILTLLYDKPLIQWVWEKACSISYFNQVVIAIDAEETREVVQSFGANYIMTSQECLTGTDRLVEVMQKGSMQADIWVNWQADEPFINEQMITDLLQSTSHSDIWTLKKRIIHASDILSPHITKVVCNHEGYALYFSRSAIPHYRDQNTLQLYYQHIGLYAFSQTALEKISRLDSCSIEEAEKLEQLRFLFYNLRICVNETLESSLGIDLPEHLAQAEKHLRLWT